MTERIQATLKFVQQFAEGGLVSAANDVKDAGRYGDDMVVHINKEEFDEMREMYGEPTINPETGLPEFFLGKIWKAVKSNIIPAAIGAGLGFLTSGPAGALAGALGNAFGGGGEDAGANVLSGQQSTGGFYNADMNQPSKQKSGGFNGIGALGGIASLLADALGARKDKKSEAAAAQNAQAQAQFNAPLPEYNYNREYVGAQPADYTQTGEQQYFTQNQFADGGGVGMMEDESGESQLHEEMEREGFNPVQSGQNYISGSSDGRADNITAKLSEGEYVFSAEDVAHLGNGNNAAGAARLDEMRTTMRKHRSIGLEEGEMSPDALHPLQYLDGGS